MSDNDRLIKCDNMEGTGEAVQKDLDGTFLHATKIKSKSKIQSIDSLCNNVVIRKESISI